MVPNISHVLTDEDVSPVTLNDHWSRLARLILLASMSAVGSVGNVFMMSAVMIEDYLRKRGKLTPFFSTSFAYRKYFDKTRMARRVYRFPKGLSRSMNLC